MLTTDRPATEIARVSDRRGRWLDRLPVVLLAAVLALAAAVRWREFMDVPSFTDETDEVLRGLAIARGQLLPLVNDDAYIGALFNYLVAGLFLVGGPSATDADG